MSDNVDDIRKRMAQVRRSGQTHVAELGQAMGRVTDWREHYKAHPWFAVAAAMATGYFVAPKRHLSPKSNGRAVPQTESSDAKETAQSITTGAIGGMIGTFASRMIKDYLSNVLRQQIMNRFEHRENHADRAPYYPEHRR